MASDSSSSSPAQVLSEQLGYPLNEEEARLLSALSAEGVAKVNVDLSRGVGLAKILEQLRKAQIHLKQRRANLEDQLCSRARLVAGILTRPLTTDELALLVDGSVDEILAELQTRATAGEAVEEVLEELAAEHKFESMRRDALFCSNIMKMKVSLHALSPLECIPGIFVPGQNSQNCVKRSSRGAFVCASGAAVWFDEKLARQAEASCPAEGAARRSGEAVVLTPTPPPQPKCTERPPYGRSVSLPPMEEAAVARQTPSPPNRPKSSRGRPYSRSVSLPPIETLLSRNSPSPSGPSVAPARLPLRVTWADSPTSPSLPPIATFEGKRL
eukprot:RCo017787